jgi:hypothetical protein
VAGAAGFSAVAAGSAPDAPGAGDAGAGGVCAAGAAVVGAVVGAAVGAAVVGAAVVGAAVGAAVVGAAVVCAGDVVGWSAAIARTRHAIVSIDATITELRRTAFT